MARSLMDRIEADERALLRMRDRLTRVEAAAEGVTAERLGTALGNLAEAQRELQLAAHAAEDGGL